MDENEVDLLARYENARWTAPSEVHTLPPIPERVETGRPADEQEKATRRQGLAYWPLGSAEPVAAEGSRMANFRFIEATRVGRVLVMRFSWLPDTSRREFLMHWDLSQLAEKDLAVVSALLFERLIRTVGSPDWMHRNTVALSSRISLVIPVDENP